ncbi:MAG: hypothetical protein ABUL77_04815 [Bacteroidota bacterium]
MRSVSRHDHGKQVGAAWRFHPDGSLFSLGLFVDGEPRGVHRRYANPQPQAERLQSCCVPPGAWQLRQDYRSPVITDRLWFDREGAPLLESGEPYPPRPSSVSSGARFHEGRGAWEAGTVAGEKGENGARTRWSREGVLRSIEELVDGQRHGRVRSFDATGALIWDGRFAGNRLSGPFRAQNLPAGYFADAAIRHQEGHFRDDQAEGVWRYLDDEGAPLHVRDLGEPIDAGALAAAEVMVAEGRPPAAWRALASSLLAQRRVGEALLASARASAAAGDPADLKAALDVSTVALGADAARAEADGIAGGGTERLVPLIDQLKRGGDPATLLWEIARAVQGADRAALDFVTAALLLAPTRAEPLSTRVLLLASLGQVEAARADVTRLAAVSAEQAEMLALVLRAYFPRFDFWPAREPLVLQPGEDGVTLERSSDEVRDVIMRYAARLQRLRASLRDRVGDDVTYMIPDLSALLPDGPVPLRRWTFTMSPEEYSGAGDDDGAGDGGERAGGAYTADGGGPAESIEITVDETHGLEDSGDTALFSLLRRARADWSALTWLCWAAGMDAPALPAAIHPPAAFGRAALMTMERTWRCRDKQTTSGLLALTKGIPGFDWEGTPIDLVPTALVDVALDEYLEARAVFSWLCDPANRSPWQDDLRGTD